MLAVLIMIAAVIIPLIMFFFVPNAPPPNNRTDIAANPPQAPVARNQDSPPTSNPNSGKFSSGRRSEMPSAEVVALQARLHISKVNATITVSLHRNFTEGATVAEYDGLDRVLTLLSQIGDVFVLVHCNNDEDEKEEQTIRAVLATKAAYFQESPHRVLFCATHIGKVAFLRQLKPLFHVEFDPKIYEDLRPHIPVIVLHRLSSDPQIQYNRPYPNIIQQQISNLLSLTVKT